MPRPFFLSSDISFQHLTVHGPCSRYVFTLYPLLLLILSSPLSPTQLGKCIDFPLEPVWKELVGCPCTFPIPEMLSRIHLSILDSFLHMSFKE